jgi:hypothetical protein
VKNCVNFFLNVFNVLRAKSKNNLAERDAFGDAPSLSIDDEKFERLATVEVTDMTKKVAVQFACPPALIESIDRIAEEEMLSRASVIRRALQWEVRAVDGGYAGDPIAVIDPDRSRTT